jgi:alpha-galactosidase
MFHRSILFVAAALCGVLPGFGQAGIRTDQSLQQWYLDAGDTTYVIGVNDQNAVQSLYWGPHLPAQPALARATAHKERASFDPPTTTTPLEYVAWGAGLFTEPDLKVDSPNGDRTLVLVYDSAKVSDKTLEVILKDKVQPIRVHLFYQVYPEGIVARWSSIENLGKQAFRIEQAESATWNLVAETDYNVSWLTGQWGAEWQLHTEPIQAGSRIIESRRGSTGHQANPWFAIGRDKQTTEEDGPVWFGELGWSGSWRMNIERTGMNLVRVTAGFSPYDFNWTLEPGTSLETPKFYGGYTSHGQGGASRMLHRFQLAEILPTRPDPKPRPVIYNSWEATEFAVTEKGQTSLADKAAALGVERFVMDDGWFGQRLTDNAGLGDWYVNKAKFPNSLKPLIDHVHAQGMDFGLWVEPEMVNPDSDLYRAHPDWAMHFPDRQRTEARQQLLLNVAKPEVKEYIFNFLDKLVSENDIAFLKWDYNRSWSEPGWDDAPGSKPNHPDIDAQKEIYIRYVQNLYDILAKLRARYPKLEIESCSGGGGRVDLGILRYTDEVWPSDNTDALDRLTLQDGFTHAYTPETMAAWVTDVPNFLNRRTIPLQFRFTVAMQGALGIGGNLNKWTPEEMALATKLTGLYKSIRTTVQHGALYRLVRPEDSETAEVEYVAQDGSQAVLFSYLRSQHYGLNQSSVKLKGLDPTAVYSLHVLDPAKYAGELTVSGAQLMGQGVQILLSGDYDSTVIVLERK